ncbi:MAG TPA: twin-arginine translocase TatA/TatE family subunit [Kofleriaceae bacterium]|nr:twin-arginine translocase TatA/TatE family subunit [Kofleriaceae bacterium]
MFGMGGSEMIFVLILALLFLGPDKLPDAAKKISKGIRDLKKQSRALQDQIENDERIGGAIRDIKSALRGEDAPVRPPVRRTVVKKKALPPAVVEAATEPTAKAPATEAAKDDAKAEPEAETAKPAVTLPPTAGDVDPDHKAASPEQLAQLIKPVAGTVAKGEPEPEPAEPKHQHG